MKLAISWNRNNKMQRLVFVDGGKVVAEIISYQTPEDIYEQFEPLFRLTYFYKNGVHPSKKTTEQAKGLVWKFYQDHMSNQRARYFAENFEENMERMCR